MLGHWGQCTLRGIPDEDGMVANEHLNGQVGEPTAMTKHILGYMQVHVRQVWKMWTEATGLETET